MCLAESGDGIKTATGRIGSGVLPDNPTLVVRPSRQSYDRVARSEGSLSDRARKSMPLILPGLAVVALGIVYRLRDAPSVAGLVFGVALVLLIVGGGLGIRELTFSRARLEVGDDGIA